MSKDGYLFNVTVVVPGENDKDAYHEFLKNPKKYLPQKLSERIPVTGVDCTLRAITCYGQGREPTEKEKAYANVHGWDFSCCDTVGWSFQKGDIRVIGWSRGWAPSHPATGVFDNAAWGSAIHAMNVADQMFFDGHKDDILGWFGLSGGLKPHPARPSDTVILGESNV